MWRQRQSSPATNWKASKPASSNTMTVSHCISFLSNNPIHSLIYFSSVAVFPLLYFVALLSCNPNFKEIRRFSLRTGLTCSISLYSTPRQNDFRFFPLKTWKKPLIQKSLHWKKFVSARKHWERKPKTRKHTQLVYSWKLFFKSRTKTITKLLGLI